MNQTQLLLRTLHRKTLKNYFLAIAFFLYWQYLAFINKLQILFKANNRVFHRGSNRKSFCQCHWHWYSILNWHRRRIESTLKTPYRCGSDIWVVARLCCRSQYDAKRIVVASIRVELWQRYTYHKTGYRYQSDTYRYNRVTMYKDFNSNN